jgi:hypothetical protein
MQAFDHSGRPGDVVNRRDSILEVSVEHLLIDDTPLTLPRTLW